MILNFRQGIARVELDGLNQPFFVNATVSGLDLVVNDIPLQFAIAHRDTNYLITENSTVNNAWDITSSTTPLYLYIDINKKTGDRTFGYTDVEPVNGLTQPPSPVEGLHWFDNASFTTKAYASGLFVEVIRVFCAIYDNGAITYYPQGTQVGILSSSAIYKTGRIVFDGSNKAIKKSNSTFFTSEDEFIVNGSVSQITRLESNVITAVANEVIAAYSVVKYTDFDQVNLAAYEDIGSTVLAIAGQSGTTGEIIDVIPQGLVTNLNWNWSAVGNELWVDVNGELTEVDPNQTDPLRLKQVPIARVISTTSILFEQGLGGKGEKGDSGDVIGTSPATTSTLGLVRVATTPPDPLNPTVVTNTDPRLTDARVPTAHTHVATDVNITPFDGLTSTDVQAISQEIYSNVLKLAGGTLTGTLVLSADPINPLEPATKQYVDGVVSAGSVTSIFGRTGAVTAQPGDYASNQVSFTPTGSILSLNVQDAVASLDSSTLKLSGGTLTGTLTLNNNPALPLEAATKQYVDNSIADGTVNSVFSRTGDVLPQSGDYQANQISFSTTLTLSSTDQQAATEEVDAKAEAALLQFTQLNLPYDIPFFIAANPAPSTVIGSFLVNRNLTITSLTTNSVAIALTAPSTTTTVLPIKKNGSPIGDVTFPSGSTTGTVTISSNQTFVSGDLITVETAGSVDVSITGITITLDACATNVSCS